jgi:Reverse transcriptase (RNA-dependent DNA polymerase)
VQSDGFGEIRSYLCGWTQCVRVGSTKSSIIHLTSGVPQGSVLGPILFVLYIADLVRLVERHSLQVHLYDDDTQVFRSCPPRDVNAPQARLMSCLDDVALWMRSNRLQLKIELLWCSTARRRDQLPSEPLRVGPHLVNTATSVRDPAICSDADLSGRTHVTKTARCCGFRSSATVEKLVRPSCSPLTHRWSCHWFSADWITATQRRAACRTTNVVDCSLFWMQQPSRHFVCSSGPIT